MNGFRLKHNLNVRTQNINKKYKWKIRTKN